MRRARVLAAGVLGVLATAPAAQAEDCHRGDVQALTDADLAELANKTCVVGSLEIGGNVTSLRVLSKLSSIDGSLGIHGARKLTSLAGLDNLERVTGQLSIGGPKRGVPGLRTIAGLNKLVEIGGDLRIAGGYIFRPGNSVMAPVRDVTGLRSLRHVKGSVTLFDVDAFRGLNALMSIDGNLTFSHSRGSELRGFANLEHVGGDIIFEANDNLRRIAGLRFVKTIGGDVLAGCPNRNKLLTEKALRAWSDDRQVTGTVLFVAATVPHSSPAVIGGVASDPCDRP